MPWNVWLAKELMEMGRRHVLIDMALLGVAILVLIAISAWYSEWQNAIAAERSWAERTGQLLLKGLKSRVYDRIAFDFGLGFRNGSIRIHGNDINFILDCGEELQLDVGVDYVLYQLFERHENRIALLQLMRYLHELALVDVLLHCTQLQRRREFFISAEVVPFPKVA